MPSTLHLFRKHQKVLMVMTTGLAMISFVILGAASNARPEEMPAALVVLALAAMFGGAAWVIGQVNGKSSEYVTVGAVAGAVLGLWLSWGRQDPTAIYMDSGNLTGRQVFEMKQRRNLVNRFVSEAYQRVNGFNAAMAEQFGMRVLFRYSPEFDSDQDMAVTELLQREAERLGIDVSTAGVFDYIRGLSASPTKTLTSEQFAEIRARLGVSEEQLLSALADELKARKAYDLLYSQRPTPTPEALYEYYSKLNVQQEAEVAVLPVADFVDKAAEPTGQELEELFAKYKSNPPGYGPDGKFVEGLPGFRQPPRVKLAYLEAVFDTFEKQVAPVTDAEIEARYEELKKRPLGDPFNSSDFSDDLPAIPPGGLLNPLEGMLPKSLTPPSIPPVEDAKPDTPAPPADGAKPETTPPAAPAAPATEPAKSDAAPPAATPPAATPETTTPPPAAPPAAPAPDAAAPPAAPADKPSTMLPGFSKLSFVSFQDDQPPPPPTATSEEVPATPPATPPPAAPAATTEGAPDTPPAAATPATTAPGLPPAPPSVEGAATPPADPPLPTVRPLDDKYREEIKQEIIRERTQALMEKKIEEATKFVAEEIGSRINTPPAEKGHITKEEASKKLKAYVEKNNLVFVETSWLSFNELADSEDFPVGSAAAINHPQKAVVARDVFESFGRSMSYLPRPAASLKEDSSHFVYWLTEERPDGEPKDMDDPIVKEQVVKTWRDLKARTKAEERAAVLMKLAKEAGKPLTEVLAEQSVTGVAETTHLEVRPTGKFSWYRMSVVPSRSMQRESSPTLSEIPGLKPLGDEFMSTVFEKLKPGELGVAASADKSEVYLVRIASRNPSTPEELEKFRQTFLTRGLANEYFDLSSRDWARYGRNPLDDLIKRNNVQFPDREQAAASK